MDFNGINEINQQEETESLIINNNRGSSRYFAGAGVATVKVVEYMLSSMSNELLRKFPDNSAFDFDYTQSSIWSPLVPHPSNPSSPAPELQRKLSYDEEEHGEQNCCFRIHHKFGRKKRRRSGVVGFGRLGPICSNSVNVIADPAGGCSIQAKGWKKVLKAATKRFKMTMKKKDSGLSQISY
ncbi:hypothetical protein L1987_22913 [Smallanthus sonchifolius]|uniref:Uncharacterized protein n=1 Tax=Smallanthus sonchifolius TaxID=185202 RepID=A0ACB9IFF6_9ASTR|nr:hypothetical protein L1987_22913 [Smallanthus sonchifolius]